MRQKSQLINLILLVFFISEIGTIQAQNPPYEVQPGGTESSISSISVEDMFRFHSDKFVTSRMLLVVV